MKRLLVVPMLLLLTAGVVWLARGPIAANRLRGRLEALGYQCDALLVDVNADMSMARVEPFSCTSTERTIERIVVESPLRVELEMLRPRRAIVPSARIEVRRDSVRVETEADTWLGSSASAAIVKMLRVFDADRAAHFEQFDVTTLDVVLGGEEGTHIQVEDIQVQPHASETGAVSVAVGTVRVPTRGVSVTFEELSCRVARTHATIEGAVGGAARIGSIEMHREWSFVAQVTSLDTESPRLHFERVESD